MPASFARRRMAGDVNTRRLESGAAAGDTPAVVAAAVPDADKPAPRRAAPFPLAAPAPVAAGAAAAVSNTTNSAPTATMSPGCPVVESTFPVTGDGTSTAAFSVITSTSPSSSDTSSPGFTFQAPISASTVPSPRSGSLKTNRLIQLSSMTRVSAAAMRPGPGKYSHSNAWGYGVSQPVTRAIGASKYPKH